MSGPLHLLESSDRRERSVEPIARRWEPTFLLGGLVLVLGIATCWSWASARNAGNAARRAQENFRAARQAALVIRAAKPAMLENAGKSISDLLSQVMHSADCNDRALRSRTIRSLGPIGDTGVVRSEARVELAGLTQMQVAKIVDGLESTALPIAIESATLTVGAGEQWDLTLELSWFQKASHQAAD